MKKRSMKLCCIPVVLLMFFYLGGSAMADPLTDEGAEWLAGIEELAAAAEGLSINVEEVQFAVESFFDVFVDAVLREGLPPDVEDPLLGTALTPDEVTDIIRRQGPELYELLRLVLPDGQVIPVAPGALVFKWDREGRWSRGPHKIEIYNWVRINQWIRASMSASKLVWKVFKPGVYSTDCMYLNVHSNGAMTLTLDNLGPLTGDAGTAGVNTAYALSEYIQTPPDLVLLGQTMGGANPVIDWVPDQATGEVGVGPHALVKVWNSIEVSSFAPPGLYTTNGPSAVITVAPEI
jgi:hypothetical protein